MMDCKLQRGPCSEKPAAAPPPCPPPPKPPFPWIYVWPWVLFFTVMGAIYKIYLWKEERDRLNASKPAWKPRLKVKRPRKEQDLPPCVQYLIVGAGAAGWSAYKSIMQHHPTAKVFIISSEDCLPYIRQPMSKFMWWNKEPPDLKLLNYVEEGKRKTMYLQECKKFMDPVKFYRKEIGPAVSIATGWCVVRVDPEQHVIYIKTTCGEQPMYYERLLLATGSRSKNLTVFQTAPKKLRDKVCTLRTIRDLEIAFRKVKESKHVVIIGSGPLGSELAWSLGKMNQKIKEEDPEAEVPEFVNIIKDRGMLSGILPEYLGEWALEKIKNQGIKVIPNAQVYDAFLTNDGRVQLTLSNGSSVITDYIFVAVGTSPRNDIAERSNLEIDQINGGIVVNTELEARKHLYAAGDVASIYSEWKDTRFRFEHYSNAVDTGYLAGVNMTGYWDTTNLEPHFLFELGDDVSMEVVGEVGACMATVGIFKQCEDEDEEPVKKMNVVEAASGDRPCYKKSNEYKNRYKRGILFYIRDEYVVGMVFWNVPPVDDRKLVVTEMLRARPHYKDINLLAEVLGFPETQCVYHSPEAFKEPGPCIKNYKVW